MTKEKIIFVTPAFQSFILQDIKVLGEKYQLIINNYNWRKKELAPIFMIMQFFHLLAYIFESKFIVVHFGGYWSFLPALFGKICNKPVYIILHGTDCASIPSLNYGSLRIPLLRWFCKMSYEWATMLLPVSESLVRCSNTFYENNASGENGFLHHFPHLLTPYHVIPNGFDANFWKIDDTLIPESNTFLAVLSAEQFILKGGDLIVEMAKRFPECEFAIAGMEQPLKSDEYSSNLKFLGKLNSEQLRAQYQRSTYYFQLSIFEGFGCALSEAMLCGCTPITSDVNELPNISGLTGKVLTKRNVNLLETLVRQTLEPSRARNQEARNRIMTRFSFERRKRLLLDILPK